VAHPVHRPPLDSDLADIPQAEASTVVNAEVAAVAVAGEINMGTVNILEQQLDRALGRRPLRLVVDLAGVKFLDAAGVTVLIQANARAHEQSCEMYLRGVRPNVERTLTTLGVNDLFLTY
jgi:anti-sigma B factor antagonist